MYIYGKNVVREKLLHEEKINKAYLDKNFNDQDILRLLKEKNIKRQYVDKKILNNKVEGLHQGIILEIDDIKTYTYEEMHSKLQKANSLVVMLDHLEDPHNFGAIIRTSEALGVDAIIIPSDRSVKVNETVVKTSTGSIYNIPIIKVANLTNTIEKLQKDNYWIVGTDMEGINYTDIDYNCSICLVIGNEGKGMSQIIRNNCDYIAKIPMKGKVNSLNASVSCGIVLSEIVRKRGTNEI